MSTTTTTTTTTNTTSTNFTWNDAAKAAFGQTFTYRIYTNNVLVDNATTAKTNFIKEVAAFYLSKLNNDTIADIADDFKFTAVDLKHIGEFCVKTLSGGGLKADDLLYAIIYGIVVGDKLIGESKGKLKNSDKWIETLIKIENMLAIKRKPTGAKTVTYPRIAAAFPAISMRVAYSIQDAPLFHGVNVYLLGSYFPSIAPELQELKEFWMAYQIERTKTLSSSKTPEDKIRLLNKSASISSSIWSATIGQTNLCTPDDKNYIWAMVGLKDNMMMGVSRMRDTQKANAASGPAPVPENNNNNNN